MAIRSFIFCDVCNPQAIRVVDRRNPGGERTNGRRLTDARAWHESKLEEARADGWLIDDQGHHVCPRCAERKLHLRVENREMQLAL